MLFQNVFQFTADLLCATLYEKICEAGTLRHLRRNMTEDVCPRIILLRCTHDKCCTDCPISVGKRLCKAQNAEIRHSGTRKTRMEENRMRRNKCRCNLFPPQECVGKILRSSVLRQEKMGSGMYQSLHRLRSIVLPQDKR